MSTVWPSYYHFPHSRDLIHLIGRQITLGVYCNCVTRKKGRSTNAAPSWRLYDLGQRSLGLRCQVTSRAGEPRFIGPMAEDGVVGVTGVHELRLKKVDDAATVLRGGHIYVLSGIHMNAPQ